MKKQIILLVLLFGFISTITASPKDTITVATTHDFMKAIRSNRVVLLTKHIELSDKAFILDGITNFEIIGNANEPIKITTQNTENTVITIQKSRDITLKNLSIGHWPDVGYCHGNVLDIVRSDVIKIYDCDLFGSGVIGINMDHATAWCYDTVIRDCSEDILEDDYHSSLVFSNCTFYLNKDNTVAYPAPQFINCTFYDTDNKLIIDKYNGFFSNKPLKIQAELETDFPVWKRDPNENGTFEGACTSPTKIEASSCLKSTNAITYQAANMYDIKIDSPYTNTAWVEGVKGYGIGEKISFTIESIFPKDGGEEGSLTADLTLVNGYAKNKSIWEANSRVKQFKVYRNKKIIAIVNLLDSPNVQSFSLGDSVYKNRLTVGEKIDFVITKVYKGKKYKDTAITFFSFDCAP